VAGTTSPGGLQKAWGTVTVKLLATRLAMPLTLPLLRAVTVDWEAPPAGALVARHRVVIATASWAITLASATPE
jgi:hypothetical protein